MTKRDRLKRSLRLVREALDSDDFMGGADIDRLHEAERLLSGVVGNPTWPGREEGQRKDAEAVAREAWEKSRGEVVEAKRPLDDFEARGEAAVSNPSPYESVGPPTGEPEVAWSGITPEKSGGEALGSGRVRVGPPVSREEFEAHQPPFGTLVQDRGPIAAIQVRLWSVRVGDDEGITEIRAYLEPGEGGYVPWLAVLVGEEVRYRVPARLAIVRYGLRVEAEPPDSGGEL